MSQWVNTQTENSFVGFEKHDLSSRKCWFRFWRFWKQENFSLFWWHETMEGQHGPMALQRGPWRRNVDQWCRSVNQRGGSVDQWRHSADQWLCRVAAWRQQGDFVSKAPTVIFTFCLSTSSFCSHSCILMCDPHFNTHTLKFCCVQWGGGRNLFWCNSLASWRIYVAVWRRADENVRRQQVFSYEHHSDLQEPTLLAC